MASPFFPSPAFAWSFFLVLLMLLDRAAIHDLNTLFIPRTLTLTMLGLGVLASVSRCAWLQSGLSEGSIGSGMLQGLLFAGGGFLFTLALFLPMLLLGTCRGGDVKLFAAVGAWCGVQLTLVLLVGSMVFVVLLVLLGCRPRQKTVGLWRLQLGLAPALEFSWLVVFPGYFWNEVGIFV